jgi:glycosyltransferase involved in cell wall biosynthesis
MHIAIVSNTAWYLFNFRLNLLEAMKNDGHSLILVVPEDEYSEKLNDLGFKTTNIYLKGSSINPIKEIYTIFNIYSILHKNKVDLVLSFTPKANIYSAIISILKKIPFIPGVSGLGRVFIKRNIITYIVLLLYKLTFNKAMKVFFENLDDKKLFISYKIISEKKSIHVPGTGIDLKYFKPLEIYKCDNLFKNKLNINIQNTSFLLMARILWDKGIGEYVSAARVIRKNFPNVKFKILGFLDVSNPSAISRDIFNKWIEEGVIEFSGKTDDVRPFISESDCVVLPSYREGLPRTLLEAASMARPIITTNVPGCKDTLVDGLTGFLCEPANAEDLASKICSFLLLSCEERLQMGSRGRRFIQENFDESIVINKYLNIINSIKY